MSISSEVEQYLNESAGYYPPGQDEYFARIALEQANIAFREGNYGIGAVAVVATVKKVSEFPNRNAMITGIGVTDHAETRALFDIRSGRLPIKTYNRNLNQSTADLPEGISVFGTLEPCPMCDCALTNVGAKLSVSTVLDGQLIQKDGLSLSNGAANAIGEKGNIKPQVWQWIQKESGLVFRLLDTEDTQLVTLSRRIFEETREEIDTVLAQRGN